MSTFDVNNPPPSPDSDLDPDLTLVQNFTVEDSGSEPIAPGDWVDVDPEVIAPDPDWGFSFQVSNVYPDAQAVGILVRNPAYDPEDPESGNPYSETQLSAAAITNNFRRVPRN